MIILSQCLKLKNVLFSLEGEIWDIPVNNVSIDFK